ncbi:hypothetical protein Hamer_G026330, partial [Homarus americanus]
MVLAKFMSWQKKGERGVVWARVIVQLIMLLILVVEKTATTTTLSSRLVVGPKSPYCHSQKSDLVCNFTGTQEPVYVEESLFLEDKVKASQTVKIIDPSVLHLSHVMSLKNMIIYEAGKVLVSTVSKSTHTDNCTLRNLQIFKSTVTNIPSNVMHLTVISSKVTYMELQPCIQHVSLVNSHIKFFRTIAPLHDSAILKVASSTIDHIEEVWTSANANLHFLTSTIICIRMEKVRLGQNTSVFIRETMITPMNSTDLRISPGTKVTLQKVNGTLTMAAATEEEFSGSSTCQQPTAPTPPSLPPETTTIIYWNQFMTYLILTFTLSIIVILILLLGRSVSYNIQPSSREALRDMEDNDSLREPILPGGGGADRQEGTYQDRARHCHLSDDNLLSSAATHLDTETATHLDTEAATHLDTEAATPTTQ